MGDMAYLVPIALSSLSVGADLDYGSRRHDE